MTWIIIIMALAIILIEVMQFRIIMRIAGLEKIVAANARRNRSIMTRADVVREGLKDEQI